MIQVTVISDEAKEALQRLKAWGVGESFFEGIGQDLIRMIQDNFIEGHDPWGNSWPDLAPSTLKQRTKQGYGVQPLLRTYELMGSIDAEYRPDGFLLTAGDGLPDGRAWWNQWGTNFAPDRPFFPLRSGGVPDLPDSMLDMIDEHLIAQFKELNS